MYIVLFVRYQWPFLLQIFRQSIPWCSTGLSYNHKFVPCGDWVCYAYKDHVQYLGTVSQYYHTWRYNIFKMPPYRSYRQCCAFVVSSPFSINDLIIRLLQYISPNHPCQSDCGVAIHSRHILIHFSTFGSTMTYLPQYFFLSNLIFLSNRGDYNTRWMEVIKSDLF